jgi:carboxyl-terminal processing protease
MGGIGLEFTQRNGALTVISPIDGTPAAQAGLKSGDIILKINGVAVTGLPLYSAISSLRGPVGSNVTMKILRQGAYAPTELRLTRAAVQISSVSYRKEGTYGYVRIACLDGSTVDDVRSALDHLGEVKGYVLDLRNDPGGLLDTAVSVAREFIVKGTVLSTRERTPRDNQTFSASGADLAKGKPIAILVNGGTASGAEAIAGALQDNHRAIVLGMPTFGEGSVQTIIPVSGGGALRLTTASMVLPSGRLIQEEGIKPDRLVSDVPSDDHASGLSNSLTESTLEGHIPGHSESGTGQAVLYPAPGRTDDFQLTTAIAILEGKM